MIPKVIHYCWFGGNPLPDSAKKCIASWKKYFPEYEIKEWNENNFDVSSCDYVKEAYEAKKWAFVSDYARFWILYHYGGLYFDTDVEVIKEMIDIVERGAFMACEPINPCTSIDVHGDKMREGINPGLGLATEPGLILYKELLDYYDSFHFQRNENGTYDTVVDYTTRIMKKHGFLGNGSIEDICGVRIYPAEFFCPMDYRSGELNITENTYTIHWYSASWQSRYSRFKTFLKHLLGKRITDQIMKLKCKIKR